MGKRKVKEYNAEFKTKVVLEVLKESQTQAEIASKYKIPSSTIPSWVKHFLGNAENVFKGRQLEKNHKEDIDKYGIPEIFNTDQGSQFTSEEFIKVLKSNGIKVSMDGVGRALDNIFIERYWKSFKYESVYLHNYFNVFDAKLKTSQYVTFYNSRRFHSSLDYKTPDQIYFANLPKTSQAMHNEFLEKKLS